MSKFSRWINSRRWRKSLERRALTPEEYWEYKDTLVDCIAQGAKHFLLDDCREEQFYEDMADVLDWAEQYQFYRKHYLLEARNREEYKRLLEECEDDPVMLVITKTEYNKFLVKQRKAFKILADRLEQLWD